MAEGSSHPGAEHRRPRRSSVTYAVRSALASWLSEEAERAASDLGPYRLLDVGCGIKPYYPFFQPYARAFVGVDVDNPAADLVGAVEALPVPDESFDLVLCTQVLEHAPDPDRAVQELWRVTAPGGRVLASTHGVQVYHPSPEDYWRFTHAWLELLFRRNGQWRALAVRPAGGTATCLAALVAIYADLLWRRLGLVFLARASVFALNLLGPALDRLIPSLRRPGPGTLFLNYHLVADKPA